MKKFQKINNLICEYLDVIAAVAMAFVFAVVFLNVVLRYFFKASFAWSDEAARYTFICLCLFGMVTATRDNAHFTVTILTNALPKIVQRILSCLTHVISLALTIFMVKGGFEMADVLKNTITPGMQIPASTSYYLLIFSGILMIFYLLCLILVDITGNTAFVDRGETQQLAKGEENT